MQLKHFKSSTLNHSGLVYCLILIKIDRYGFLFLLNIKLVHSLRFHKSRANRGNMTLSASFQSIYSALVQKSSTVSLNSCGTSILTQCPAFSKMATLQFGSLIFHCFTASNSIGISNLPHPIIKG